MERRGEFAAASLQTESYLEREHNARWTVLGVGYATRGITANVLWRIDTRAILPANRATKGCLWRIDTRAILPANRATKGCLWRIDTRAILPANRATKGRCLS